MPQQSTARRVGQGHATKLIAVDFLNPVVAGKPLVDECIVRGQ